jgi:hypothetical protein
LQSGLSNESDTLTPLKDDATPVVSPDTSKDPGSMGLIRIVAGIFDHFRISRVGFTPNLIDW